MQSLRRALSIYGVAFVLTLLASGASAGGSGHTLELRHRPAKDLIPLLAPVLEPDEKLSGDGFILIVHASANRYRELADIVKALDRPLKNLRISVRLNEGRDSESDTAAIVYKRPDSSKARMEPAYTRRAATRSGEAMQVINVLEGQRASIRVSERLPEVNRFFLLTGRYEGLGAAVDYTTVSTGFDVVAHVKGRHAWLETTPRFSFYSGAGVRHVTFNELGTRVRVALGEWVNLGALVDRRQKVVQQILGGQSGTRDTRTRIDVRIQTVP